MPPYAPGFQGPGRGRGRGEMGLGLLERMDRGEQAISGRADMVGGRGIAEAVRGGRGGAMFGRGGRGRGVFGPGDGWRRPGFPPAEVPDGRREEDYGQNQETGERRLRAWPRLGSTFYLSF